MTFQVDIMIVGDSKSGHDILDKLASNKPMLKMAFISKEFKSFTTRDYTNVEYFKGEVEFTDYKNRLFCCYLKNGHRIYATHLIIASGVAYSPFLLNNKPALGVYNTTDDIPKSAKEEPAVVICNKNSDVKFALEVAKKYKRVYLCTKSLTIEGITQANTKKLEQATNLVVLPNTTISKAIAKNGTLRKVELSNYSTLNCMAIYVKTDTTPDITFIPTNLISRNEHGYLIVKDNAESTLVPKCFAVGNCVQKYTKSMEQSLIENILNDFK